MSFNDSSIEDLSQINYGVLQLQQALGVDEDEVKS